ncbi:peptidoglycan editing factor PgeF [Alicyclobacillus acidiphilus]|uniref:peptidoglycan editing factor PgeF n=1 Tax=Alicyclobacillus acidiphilus TaxID=182455 RepID=UPI001FDFB677|nr:peptidoglycan editing factor PgeF [Alicyclobacillus acidiphilus]
MLTNIFGRHGGIGVRPTWATPEVRAMFSCRHDDSDKMADLDVGFHGRVAVERAVANRDRVAHALGMTLDAFVFVRQVHGSHIFHAGVEHRGLGARAVAGDRPEADAIVTNAPGVALAVLVADCVPVLFFDPVQRVVAAAHSGWRGTVAGISGRVVSDMQTRYGSNPADIRVAIGPAMRQCCYEVDDHVASRVIGTDMELALRSRFGRPGKYWFSMPDAIRADLAHHGIEPSHVDDTGLCTSCRVEHFFSHRVEQGQSGRQMAVIALAE